MTREEKYRAITEECISRMCEEDKSVYRPVISCALALGYVPKPVKKSDKSGGDDGEISFTKSSVNRTLLRVLPMTEKALPKYPIKQAGRAQIRLVFFATPEYSEPFQLGIKAVIENFGGKYTGCYGCGRCNGKPQGYIYKYPDGKKVFRCGRELIELPPLGAEYTEEVCRLMKAQDEFWSTTC